MMLTTTAVILSSLIAYGAAYEWYPALCKDETFTLSIASNRLSQKFITSGSIRCINITSGNIRSIEKGAFDGVPNLTYLNLEWNYISPSDLFSFGSIANLKALILSNQEDSFDDTVPKNYIYPEPILSNQEDSSDDTVPINYIYPELQYLNLRNNRISNLIYEKNCFPKLKHLDISGNGFSSLQFVAIWKNTLTHLQLDNNQIYNISLSALENLEMLTLDNNYIQAIDNYWHYSLDLTGLKNLKHLSVAANEIFGIDQLTLNEAVKLRYLDLSYNKLLLTLDSATFAFLTALEALVLNGNKFETIPFTTPLNITALWMNCNSLVNLTTSSFSNVPYLRTLSLGRNEISSIDEDAFYPLQMLEELYLNDNYLNYLPRLWNKSMENLRYLDLSRNKFTSLDYVFGSNFVPLQELHLDGNPLESIKKDSLAMLPENVTIYLNFGRDHLTNVCTRSSPHDWSTEYD